MRNYSVMTCVVLIVAALLLQGCAKHDQVTGPDGPEQLSLPSTNTMTMNLSFFDSAQVDSQSVTSGKLSQSAAAAAPAALKLNYLNAAVRVLFLNVIAYSALAEPVAAFATAIHSVPQYQQDSSWLWTYIFVDEHGSEYSIFLRGKRMDSYVAWSMEVSSSNPAMLLDHFVWFDGEQDIDGRSGYWQFYEPDSGAATVVAGTSGVQTVRIDWRNTSANDRRLAFLINKPDDTAEGSTLVFDEAPEESMISFDDAASGNSGTINWNRDGSGSIQWPDYKDGVKSCWDVSQYDTDCQ